MEVVTAKTNIELRHEMRERLAALTMDQVHAASAAVAHRLAHLPALMEARSVLIYVSRRHEIDTHGVIQKLLRHGHKVFVPHFDEATHQYAVSGLCDFHGELKWGKFDILEPKPEAIRPAKVEAIAAFLLPGLAFDKQGTRLGRGKAYFDRLLHLVRGVKIALAHEFQVLNEVPAEPHDVPVDFIVTETRVVHCQRK
jgi:5-formyltetrahydrofolate cyclo-ligase